MTLVQLKEQEQWLHQKAENGAGGMGEGASQSLSFHLETQVQETGPSHPKPGPAGPVYQPSSENEVLNQQEGRFRLHSDPYLSDGWGGFP